MKKKLIILNGTMGIGKTTACKKLYKSLENSVWLDGDWCWMMNPFVVNQENIEMVENNITYLLRNFLANTFYDYVIFSWVIHKEETFTSILKRLDDLEFQVYKITLTCSKESLIARLQKDVMDGVREKDIIDRSVERLNMYNNMDTIKIDTTDSSIDETIEKIIEIIKREKFTL